MSASRLVRPVLASTRQRLPQTAIRSYAAVAPDSKPPIALFGVDGTYASALVRTIPAIEEGGIGEQRSPHPKARLHPLSQRATFFLRALQAQHPQALTHLYLCKTQLTALHSIPPPQNSLP
jgi:hypothetical protein